MHRDVEVNLGNSGDPIYIGLEKPCYGCSNRMADMLCCFLTLPPQQHNGIKIYLGRGQVPKRAKPAVVRCFGEVDFYCSRSACHEAIIEF